MDSSVVQLGLVRAAPLQVLLDEERKAAEETQNQPFVTGLTAYIRKCWDQARTAKQMTVEPRMIMNLRARRSEYDPEKLGQIREMGGSEIYAGLTSVKTRAAGSWLRDVLMQSGSERPWTIRPTPLPDLPPQLTEQLIGVVAQPIKQALMSGQQIAQDQVVDMMQEAKEEALASLREEARKRCDRMADKMEDQLVEGGFMQALDAFIDDITTFPSAVLKGPVIRKKKTLKWTQTRDGKFNPEVTEGLVAEWERVSPFDIYPSPAATSVKDGYLIEKHKLSREDLNEMIGVEGYDDKAIRLVLDEYGRNGLREWLTNDVAMASAEGKATTQIAQNVDGLIDALQFWGPVQGKVLIEWGMDKSEVPDPLKDYHIEGWLIGTHVIKAVINQDFLGRKPYYVASYEDVPGSFWGRSVADLVRDPQVVVNAAARSIVNNMGIASGPQVVVNVDRLAPGEDITQLTPWRIWQVNNDPTGAGQAPVMFNQPDSRIAELVGVFEKFSEMADEYSGIPKYMGGEPGGVGRTASGLSMLMGNASKSIKQVISNIDIGVMTPLLTRLYDHNMQFSDDPDLKGDVNIIARGATSLVAKDTAQVRRNEFLMATANPVDMQIVGVEGRAAILRETAKNLDMDVDKVVPPLNKLRQQLAAQSMMQQQQQGTPPAPQQAGGGQALMDNAPVTDNFSPPSQQ
jgi:hypothetical protein